MSDLEFNEQAKAGDVDFRSAETGQFVTEKFAEENPDTTVRELDEDEVNDAKMDAEVKTFADLKRVRLSRKRTVMHFASVDGDNVYFSADDNMSSYYMDKSDWEAFGSPEAVTVGVVNGDILN